MDLRFDPFSEEFDPNLYGPIEPINLGQMGIVYIVHFDRAFGHAQHYCGWTLNLQTFRKRFRDHRNGKGSKLLAAVVKAGIDWQVTIRPGTRNDERRIKNQGGLSRNCPICQSEFKSRKKC